MFRFFRRAFQRLSLLILPFLFFPLFDGFLGGVLWSRWNYNHIYQTTDKFLLEIRDFVGDDWSVGYDVPTFREFQDTNNDMGVIRVNSNDWLPKLGFMLPDQYVDLDNVVGIDKFADMQTLMRDTSCRPAVEKGKEQWLYISHYGWPLFSEWDTAFQFVAGYAKCDHKLNRTSLYFAQCATTAGFLCGVWNTRAPALVHFIVEDEAVHPDTIESGLTYSAALSGLRPVTARIIEFGLQDVYTGLPSHVFPTREEQLLAIMTGDHLYEQFDVYHPVKQMLKRFDEYMDKVGNKPNEFLWYVWEADRWWIKHVNEPLGVEGAAQFLYSLTFALVGGAAQLLVLTPYDLIKRLIEDFAGAPRRGDYIMAGLEKAEQWSFESWSDDFLARMQEQVDSSSSKNVLESVTAKALSRAT